MAPMHRPSNDAAPHWRPRVYADDEPSIDRAARTLAVSRRRAVAGTVLGLVVGNLTLPASGKRKRRRKHCGKGLKRCPDGKCYLKAKTCCPKRWGGGACWENFPVCCPPKPGHKRFDGCVADAAYCEGGEACKVTCPANSTYPYKTCNPAGSVCCPHGTPCPADRPICCPSNPIYPQGSCAGIGGTCCPMGPGCTAEYPVCCPPDSQAPNGYCLQAGNTCFT